MDPLTHTLTGVALADTGLADKTPRATATLLVAVNLPDVDALTYFFATTDTALLLRRGWTHGLIAMFLLPLLLASAVWLFDRRFRRQVQRSQVQRRPPAHFGWLLALSYLGFLTHPLLDWLNTYGIRLLMPFDGRWFYGDTLFIVDPWIWMVLGGSAFLTYSRTRRSQVAWGVLAIFCAALFVTSSGGQPTARFLWFSALALVIVLRAGDHFPVGERRLSRSALAVTVLYIVVLRVGTVQATDDVAKQLATYGIEAQDLMIGPVPILPLSHVVLIDTGTHYRFGSYEWFAKPRLRLDDQVLPKISSGPIVDAVLVAPCLRGMMNWVRYPWVEIEESGDGSIVHLMDARYARKRTASFGGAAVFVDKTKDHVCDHH